ncbi:uncharacterized protein LOC125683138 isoform X3 [Ostrea edulis]|uniref:uncharacterized protein LOC125683138 isoform X3 n=1 Tax=Ostrea edulis TaxID=37623 RepID=UPI0024AF0AD0|nr:uncharacterized protein LOC125683138 isoform X3 [Ostrea edulis]
MFSPSVQRSDCNKDGSWTKSPTYRLPPSRTERGEKLERGYPSKYPRVVLRDSLGNKLDTFTYLQEAIYRAEWNVKNSHEAVFPEEWRLPKAPNPARPDYSRTAPLLANTRSRLKLRPIRGQDVSRSLPQPRLNEIDVGDVAFVAESLNQLPRVPSLSFLHHDLLAEPKRYFQIVNQAMVQRRHYAQTDKRERVYNFPGFCTGCRRSGLCYGCERSSEPHYHVDRIMKTGGGFTYHQHDRPIREQLHKNPANWKLAFPELALKHLIKEHDKGSVSVAEEGFVEKMDGEVGDYQPFIPVASNDSCYSPTDEMHAEEESMGTQDDIVKQWAMMREGPLTGNTDNQRGKEKDKNWNRSRQENMDAMSPWTDDKTPLDKDAIDENIYSGEGHITKGSREITIHVESQDNKDNSTDWSSQQLDLSGQHSDHLAEEGEDSVKSERHSDDRQDETDNDADVDSEEEDDDTKTAYTSSTQKREKLSTSDETGSQGISRLGTTPKSKGDLSTEGRDRREGRSEKSGSSPYSPYSSRRRQSLYKESGSPSRSPTPPAFKVKPRKSRQIDSRSPFSSERKFNLPKGSGFQVKKSEKKLTEFHEFKQNEGNWKQPDKFTIKKSEKLATDFWAPPKKEKKESKKRDRVKKERPVSPDSGLESEKPAGRKSEIQPYILTPIEHKLDFPIQEANGRLQNLSTGWKLLPSISSVASDHVMQQRAESEHKNETPKKININFNSGEETGERNIACLVDNVFDEQDVDYHSKESTLIQKMNNALTPIPEDVLSEDNELTPSPEDVLSEDNELTPTPEDVLSKDNETYSKLILDLGEVEKKKHSDLASDQKVSSCGETDRKLKPELTSSQKNHLFDVPLEEASDHVTNTSRRSGDTVIHSRSSSSAISEEVRPLEKSETSFKQVTYYSEMSLAFRDTPQDHRKKKGLFKRQLRIVQGKRGRRQTEWRGQSERESVDVEGNGSLMHASIKIDTPTGIIADKSQKAVDDTSLQRHTITPESDPELNSTTRNQHKYDKMSEFQPPVTIDSLVSTDSVQELPLKSPAIIEAERVLSPPLQKISSPEQPKKERPKKTKKEVPKRLPSPVRSITPKSPVPIVEEEVTLPSREPTPEYVPTPTPKIPELPPVDIPPLPEIIEEKKEKKVKIDTRKAFEPIQVMPKIKDAVPPPPKKSKPPTFTKKSQPKKRIPSAEAPVTTEEIRQMKDPLDFLAKYCIISKDRLPYYERIYKNIVSSQPQRYERQHPLSPTTGMPITEGTSWGNHELNMFHDLVLISRGQEPKRPGLSGPEQYFEKICYTLEMLEGKHDQLAGDLHLLETKRIQQLAERARKLVPDISSVHYQKKEKKGKKKKKKKKNKDKEEEIPAKVILSRADITDDVIVSRIDEKLLKKLMKEPAQHLLGCEIDRCREKLGNIEDRLIQLEGEKNIIRMYCMELFFDAQNDNSKPKEFRRQQSFLYKTLHPDPDDEMNREEVEGALQIVNHNLLTENEFGYMYHILNLTGRRKINFKLFCVIAALSERITHMDPVIRELLNKEKGWKRGTNDYESLDVRMNRSKELFQLLDEGDSIPYGNALASSLAVELTAGGLSPELTSYVMSKFNREGKGYVDFLDYVTYVPLFVEIHEKIIKDPLCSTVRIE